jgi:hypothetical protein
MEILGMLTARRNRFNTHSTWVYRFRRCVPMSMAAQLAEFLGFETECLTTMLYSAASGAGVRPTRSSH